MTGRSRPIAAPVRCFLGLLLRVRPECARLERNLRFPPARHSAHSPWDGCAGDGHPLAGRENSHDRQIARQSQKRRIAQQRRAEAARSAAERRLAGGGVGGVGDRPCPTGASPAAGSDTGGARRAAAEHRLHHGRRRRLVQHRRLPPGHDVRQDAEPRQAGLAGHAVHRLLRRSQLHGRPGRLHHRRDPPAHGPDDRRPGRRRRRHAGPGVHDRHRAQGARLCHRPIRQEPPRRPEQVPADAARLR